MNTKKQEELVNVFLSALEENTRPLYREIVLYLSELGYHPQKERSYISFKHDLHNKQMAKMGFQRNKEQSPFFALRFSACKGYSQRFADIVSTAIEKYPSRAANCPDGDCVFCAGDPKTHVYSYTFPGGETKYHCGARALEIPNLKADDIGEIKKLIKEEHAYLLKYEAGIGA